VGDKNPTATVSRTSGRPSDQRSKFRNGY
jgi:hypothetical protein